MTDGRTQTSRPEVEVERDLVMLLLRREVGEEVATSMWETASPTQRAEMLLIASKLLPSIREWLSEVQRGN